ncbi:major facilitator superfamily domain-containing protein [Xylaria arbuscula]|nr:major facilitator superfamily domain-containing protein [Xylaria arbuscula]
MQKSTPIDEIEDMDKFPIETSASTTVTRSRVGVSGTVKLTAGKIIYVPTPTADPRDPLNFSKWQKALIIIILSIFATIGNSLVTGIGGILGFYKDEYFAAGKTQTDLTHLISYPEPRTKNDKKSIRALGNLIGMPLAYAVGRRVVFLVSSIILPLTAALCAGAKTYEWHLAARLVMGLAAGQAEALVPLITQEIVFLHERGTYLMIQNALQSIIAAVVVLFAGPIAGAITPQWWYGLGASLAGLSFVLAIFFVPETKYARSLSSFQETDSGGESEKGDFSSEEIEVATEKPPLDFERYAPRTWASDLRLWVGRPEWDVGFDMLKHTCQLFLFPNISWAMFLNGLVLGVNVAVGSVYGTIVTSAPYNWPNSSASYVNCGQIITSALAVPLLGFGSDKLIAWFAKRRGGYHEPEVRLIPLVLPMIIGTFTCVLFGQGGAHPDQYHWFTYVWGVAAYYFTFIAVTITVITYLLDSYPQRAGSVLICICAFRGIIGFGVVYAITPFVEHNGYDGAFGTFGGLTFAFAVLGVPVYIWGKRIRHFTGRWVRDHEEPR